jgi:hypothetical protein
MDSIDFNIILERNKIVKNIQDFLNNFEKNKFDLQIKRGIYLYGLSGIGKTKLIYNILNSLDYDIIYYSASNMRNKSIIDNITQYNMSTVNVLSLLQKKQKKIAIIMDEIDGMNNGDKGGINSLIKIIRPKKTKKQKLEEISFVPIICIGNYIIDKKIKELIKVCYTIEVLKPSDNQILNIINLTMPDIILDHNIKTILIDYIQNDLRKLMIIYNIYIKDSKILNYNNIKNIFKLKSFNEDTKNIANKLIYKKYSINDHNIIMNETDRTIIGLLWHENIIEYLNKLSKQKSIPLYLILLNNICYSDYIDRITFQKQIWQLNEISSLIKILYNNNIYHNNIIDEINIKKYKLQTVRFTKILTKYSTEYNNYIFIQTLCLLLNFDKKDLLSFFIKLQNNNINKENIVNELLISYQLTNLDINRIYRYINYNIDNKVNNEKLDVDNSDIIEVDN